MNYFKCHIKLIFMLVFLMHVSAMHGELSTCNEDIARYFSGLNNYTACAMKSMIFYNLADFEGDYGYLYFLTFRKYLRRGLILKPTEYCSTYFAEDNESFKNKINENNQMKFENDEQKTNFILNLTKERNENIVNSSENEFDEPFQSKDFVQNKNEDMAPEQYYDAQCLTRDESDAELVRNKNKDITSKENVAESSLEYDEEDAGPIMYRYDLEDNDDVFSCKSELSNNGFPDILTKTDVMNIFLWKKYTDCEDCKFVKGYLNHLALNIKICVDMEDPEQFCLNLSQNNTSLTQLLFEQLQTIIPVSSTTNRQPDPEMQQSCIEELSSQFRNKTNYKEIGDYVLFSKAVSSLEPGSFAKTYIEILIAYIRPGYTKSVKTFCEDFTNRSLVSKIKLCFGNDENIEETQICKNAIKFYGFPRTNNKKELILHAFHNINIDELDQNAQYVYLRAYMEHIKMNYYIKSTMESPAKFCLVSAKNITPRMYDVQ